MVRVSDTFTPTSVIPNPTWSGVAAGSGGFAPVQNAALSVPEVGYDEGGYGEGGYDTPAINIPSAPTPDWSAVTTK